MSLQVLPIALAGLVSAIASAQWSDSNLVVADRPGEQVQPKLVATADGGAYVSWFDNAAGGYDVYLQRLDAGGNESWPHNGVLVADRGFSSTQDYGLSIDAAGHALVTFRDDRFAGVQITVARVAPDGTLDWGPDGVQVTADTAFHAAPGVAGTSDGDVVVAWTNDTDVRLQRLDADGVVQWGVDITLSDVAAGEYLFSDIHDAGTGTVILSWIRQQSFMAAKHLYTQKIDAAGHQLWKIGVPVVVFDGGSLQFGNSPDFVSDDAGGAVFSWYSSTPSLQCFAQHVLSDGTEAFGHNGSAGAVNASQLRVSPDAAYDPASQEVFMFWNETDLLQSTQGVSGQRFDSSGNRLWPEPGFVVEPLGASEIIGVNATVLGTGAVASYTRGGFGDRTVHASHVESGAVFGWTPSIVTVSTQAGGKSRLVMTNDMSGLPILSWQEGDSGDDLYAQNLNADGSLGVPSCLGDIDGSGDVGIVDLLQLLAAWGVCPGCPEDLTDDLQVGITDLLALLASWGRC